MQYKDKLETEFFPRILKVQVEKVTGYFFGVKSGLFDTVQIKDFLIGQLTRLHRSTSEINILRDAWADYDEHPTFSFLRELNVLSCELAAEEERKAKVLEIVNPRMQVYFEFAFIQFHFE